MPLVFPVVIGTALAGALVALLTVARRSRDVWRFGLALGILAVAGEVSAAAVGQRSGSPDAVRRGWELAMAVGALVPATWLVFGLSFARAEPAAALWRARWLLGLALGVPVGATLFRGRLFLEVEGGPLVGPYLRLGSAGYLLEIAQILAAVVMLALMERTLRASTGSRRWLVKFLVIGVCTLFAARIYVSSQSLLFRAIDTRLLIVSAAGFGLALLSISVAHLRMRGPSELYLSPTALYGSFTTLLVALYLLAVGLLAALAGRIGGGAALPLVALLLLLALWVLALVLLSDEVRQRLRLLVSRHFRRPVYDYRLQWRQFTLRTGTTLDARELCSRVASWVAETLKLPAVTVWLVEESGGVTLGGSTLRSTDDVPPEVARAVADATQRLVAGEGRTASTEMAGLSAGQPEDLRFVMPLRSGTTTVGVVTHSDRATGVSLTDEDRELLRIAGEQAASRLLGIRLSERLARARENEAFQSLSAFFVHDLKNLASRLSLSLQNLPSRIEDPAFRADFVAMLSRSVTRIDDMCARLSPLTRRLELRLGPEDLAAVVAESLAELCGSLRGRLEQRLEPTPAAACDRDELHKVVTNLVINADEALGDGGTIRVATGVSEGVAFVSVADDGCGMTPEFVEGSLFQPFRSTKPRGLGIGLYQVRRIVEAHGGRIEVDSAPGRGSVFRVLLPLLAP